MGASALVLAPCLCGCVLSDDGRAVDAVAPAGGAVVASPFSPVRVRVFPLTHFEVLGSGEARILVFIEFKDQWGDTVKGAGTLELQLYRPDGGAGGREVRALRWEIDLADLDRNAALYDPSTRTYRVALKALPTWLSAMARGEPGGPDRVAIEAYFRTVGPGGEALTLRDRFELVGE